MLNQTICTSKPNTLQCGQIQILKRGSLPSFVMNFGSSETAAAHEIGSNHAEAPALFLGTIDVGCTCFVGPDRYGLHLQCRQTQKWAGSSPISSRRCHTVSQNMQRNGPGVREWELVFCRAEDAKFASAEIDRISAPFPSKLIPSFREVTQE